MDVVSRFAVCGWLLIALASCGESMDDRVARANANAVNALNELRSLSSRVDAVERRLRM